METMNATARWTPERCEVWTPTQNGEAALAAASEAAGLPLAKCEVYKLLPRRRLRPARRSHDWVRQAVAIAKADAGHAGQADLVARRGHDARPLPPGHAVQADRRRSMPQGNVTALHMRISGQSILAGVCCRRTSRDGKDPVVFQGLNPPGPEASIGYTFPNLLIDHAMRNPHVPPGFWRGVNLNQNTIYLECFIDEVAHATKQDPLALRRKLMAKSSEAPRGAERGRRAGRLGQAGAGRACTAGWRRPWASAATSRPCAEVSVNDDGKLKIHRIVAATDPGHAVNPQQIEAQVEGSFAYGLSAALYGECTVKDGRIEQDELQHLPGAAMDEMPKVETIVMPSGGFWGGVGEPTIAVAAPAVLNAIFAATGKRIRDLPLKNHSLKKA